MQQLPTSIVLSMELWMLLSKSEAAVELTRHSFTAKIYLAFVWSASWRGSSKEIQKGRLIGQPPLESHVVCWMLPTRVQAGDCFHDWR